MAEAPLTVDDLAHRLTQYTRDTNRRLDRLEDLVRTNGLNGAAPVLRQLEPLAGAADDLVAMAHDHREKRELEKATTVVRAAAVLANQKRLEQLTQHFWYRRYIALRAFFGDSGGKLYYAILGGVGFYLVGNTLPHLWGPVFGWAGRAIFRLHP